MLFGIKSKCTPYSLHISQLKGCAYLRCLPAIVISEIDVPVYHKLLKRDNPQKIQILSIYRSASNVIFIHAHTASCAKQGIIPKRHLYAAIFIYEDNYQAPEIE